MSNSKMREALIIARGALTLEGYEPHDGALKCIDAALAQPDDVGLSDEEIKLIASLGGWDDSYQSIKFARAIIACNEAKKKGENHDRTE